MGWIALVALLMPAAPTVNARTIDGVSLSGTIVELSAERLTLQTAEGRKSLLVDQLLEIAPGGVKPDSVQRPKVWVGLVDGSLLAAQEYTVRGGRAQLSCGDGRSLELPTQDVEYVRLEALSASAAAEWDRIVQNRSSGDLLLVRKGDTLDYHRGTLGDVTAADVNFEIDGEHLPVKRGKVAGLIYYHPPGRKLPEAICRITDASGSQWSAQSLKFSDKLEWTTPSGLRGDQPVERVLRIAFATDHIIYLSDLKPDAITWTPFFGADKSLSLLADFYGPRQNRSLDRDSLGLGGREYRKGLALSSRTSLVYRLPDRFRRLQATAGIDDSVRPHGSVRLVIRSDDRVLYESVLTGKDPPAAINVDLSGVRRLTILADFGNGLDAGNHLLLCDPRLIK